MSRVTITIETDNAAFEDMEFEVGRILRDLARKFEEANITDGNYPTSVKDINGNKVGSIKVEEL